MDLCSLTERLWASLAITYMYPSTPAELFRGRAFLCAAGGRRTWRAVSKWLSISSTSSLARLMFA